MTRRKIREHIFIMLFRVDFHSAQELEEQEQEYLAELSEASGKAKDEIKTKYEEIIKRMPEIDALIEEKAEGWNLQRMAKADITILRLAAYEILFDDEVPDGVAINEAVELSKQYGTDRSTSFINGVLASIVRENTKSLECE